MSKPVFGYWNLRGLGHPIKLALAYLGVKYEDKRYSLEPSGIADWTGEKFSLGLDFPNLPYWKENGSNVTESRAVLKTLAREKGNGVLMPTEFHVKDAEMIENVLWDVWWYLIRRCLTDTEEMKGALAKNGPPKLEQLNKFLGNKKWMLGDQITYVDFMLYEILYHYTAYDPEFLKPYSGLLALKKNFEALPTIAKYIASPEYIKSPCFHPLAAKIKI